MNKMSGYYRVRNNMRYFNNVSSGTEKNKRMDWDEEKKIKRMKADMTLSKLSMLMFVLATGFLGLAYIIYIIFGDVDAAYIEETLPGGVTTILVALMCWWLFKSNNTRMDNKHEELFGFNLEEVESNKKRKQDVSTDDGRYNQDSMKANQDKGEF